MSMPRCAEVNESGDRICAEDAIWLTELLDSASGHYYVVTCEYHLPCDPERTWSIAHCIDQGDKEG